MGPLPTALLGDAPTEAAAPVVVRTDDDVPAPEHDNVGAVRGSSRRRRAPAVERDAYAQAATAVPAVIGSVLTGGN